MINRLLIWYFKKKRDRYFYKCLRAEIGSNYSKKYFNKYDEYVKKVIKLESRLIK